MLVKRAYVYTKKDTREYPIRFTSWLSLGWRVGLIDIHNDGNRWVLVHAPSGILMACVESFVSAKALARLFCTYGVSAETTLEGISSDPLWPNMQRAYRKWHNG